MKKILAIIALGLLAACSVPPRPSNRDYTAIKTAFNEDVYRHGNRGYVVFSVMNPVINGGDTIIMENDQGEKFQWHFPQGSRNRKPAVAMLPVGEYRVVDLSSFHHSGGGNVQVTRSMTDLVKGHDVTFTVRAGEFAYLGQLTVIGQAQGRAQSGGLFSGSSTTRFNINIAVEDRSAAISAADRQRFERESGKPFRVSLMTVKPKEQ